MPEKIRTYFCIDMKSFYASVECAERGLNPFESNLVVADLTRGKNALCLAISPRMKALGIKNRCRLSEIPSTVRYEVAPPRMALYIEYAADIYGMYLNYFSPDDIHVYSIDEAFIDATEYLPLYEIDAKTLARRLMNEIATRFHIPSTAGIGTNLYLAKVALDITAKHSKDHIGYLDEQLYQKTLWHHRPITDFWQIAAGTARRLQRYGVYDMFGITQMPAETMYKAFGINAELLIDHAWGRESCLIEDIKHYSPKSKSVSFSQILPRDYSFEEAKTVMREMVDHGAQELMRRKVITHKIGIYVGYTGEMFAPTGGSTTMVQTTNLRSFIEPEVIALFEKTTNRQVPIRRIAISFEAVCDEGCEGYDLFTDWEAVEREKSLEHTVLQLKDKLGKNAVMRGFNYFEEATQCERNTFIGGHRAGYDDKRTKS